jgi:hypothetical protein
MLAVLYGGLSSPASAVTGQFARRLLANLAICLWCFPMPCQARFTVLCQLTHALPYAIFYSHIGMCAQPRTSHMHAHVRAHVQPYAHIYTSTHSHTRTRERTTRARTHTHRPHHARMHQRLGMGQYHHYCTGAYLRVWLSDSHTCLVV